MTRWLVMALALVAFATPASAQVYTGRIDVTVSDSTGAILPGVTVDISGPQSRTTVTDANGEAHFLNLAPGIYTVSAKLQGFNEYMNRTIPVGAGTNVPLRVTMAVAGVATSVEVTGAAPVTDPKRMTTSTNVTNQELQEIPSARDPWVVLQTVPGVIVDRVNVGGAESGQQSNYQAKGSASGDNTWNIDGIAITDMAALGASPTYYDFDMFQEMQVTTGGSDLTMATGGVGLNFVLKSGANTPRGSTRIYFENEDMQANNLPDDLKASIGGTTGKGNRIKEYMDYGAELGGPIFRDRLWAWGAYGKTDVTTITLANTPDQTILDNRSMKLTGQASQNIRGSYTFFRGDKLKYGRDASVSRPPETTWDQSGPTTMNKGEVNVVLSDNVFLTGRGAHVSGGFVLTPQGGLDTPWYTDDAGINRGSYAEFAFDRPQVALSADGNYFRGRHEVKFGGGYRKAESGSAGTIPGYGGTAGIHSTHDGYPTMIADIWVPASNRTQADYTHAFIGDTISWDRLTLNVGVRWDRQAAGTLESTQKGFAAFSTLLPDVTAPALEDAIVYTSFSPRIGVTYALDDARKTIARASYATFADQLGSTAASFLSTVADRGLYVYDVIDRNGNRVVDPSEVGSIADCSNTGPRCYPYGFDITNPGGAGASQHTIGDYNTPLTHEFQLGLDREVMQNFGVSGTFTFRHFNNFNRRNNPGLTGDNYRQISTFTGSDPVVGDFAVPIFGPITIPAKPSATEFRSNPDYYQRYMGLELAATKRLSNRWMARLGFSTNSHKEYFDSPNAYGNPTPGPTGNFTSGQLVVRQSTGSGKGSIYQILPAYQFVATGMYQARWGINLAANLVTRQGFATPYFRSSVVTADPLARNKTVGLFDENGEDRLPNVASLDFRVGKQFGFQRARINLDLDMFNVLNSATVLGRQYDLRLAAFNSVREIMNPRVIRVGLRVGF
ncbi:MAG: carboxypeptidase regulatory-like domain-containing protein [Acidobacteriota bacterium]|nr:carboxypeptidase regulatory-like domain-containing protein [Acidobacteriota bacterium]